MAAGSFPRSDRSKMNAREISHRCHVAKVIEIKSVRSFPFLQIRIIRSAWNHAVQPDTVIHLGEICQKHAEQSFPRTFVFETIGTPSASSTRHAGLIRQYRCKKISSSNVTINSCERRICERARRVTK